MGQPIHDEDPAAAVYWPVEQLVQVDCPICETYLPSAQPAQLDDADAPVVVRYRPDAQLVQDDVPICEVYCPAAQPMQLVDADPVAIAY